MSRQKESKLPISWESWDELNTCDLIFYDVYFEEDFGPIKAGEKFDSVSVNYGEGFLEAYGDEGQTVVHTVKFDLVPSNE